MRKFFYTLGIIAASALAFSACQKEQAINDEPQSGKLVTISFTAEKAGTETRTGIATEGDSQVSYKWTTEDASNIKLFTVDGSTLTQVANPTITIDSDGILKISATVAANATYTFRAILAGAWTGSGTNYASRKPKISDSQAPNGIAGFDPTADILVSDDKEVTVGEESTTTGDMLLVFHRQVVINKMTLKNLTAGEKIDKVVISANDHLTGYVDGSSMSGQSKSITLDYDAIAVPSDGLFPVYFVTIPKSGQSLTVVVTTNQNVYTKSFAEGKTIDFIRGQFTKFNFALPAGVSNTALTLPVEDSMDWANNGESDSGEALTEATLTAEQNGKKIYYSAIKAYKGAGGLKLGTSGERGSITTNDIDLSSAFYVTIDAKNYGSDQSQLTVSVDNDVIKSVDLTGNYQTYNINCPAATSASKVTIGVAGKRGYIKNLFIRSGGLPEINVTSNSTIEVGNSASSQEISFSIENPSSGVNLTASTEATWIKNLNVTSNSVTFDVDAQEAGAPYREATITLSYTGASSVDVTVKQAAGETSPYAAIHTSNVTLTTTGGTSASTAKVNDFDAIKAGTSSAAGSVNVTVPANKNNLHIHAAGWKGESVTLSISGASTTPVSLQLISDNGITNNSPFTLSGNADDYYFKITIPESSTETVLTFTATSGKRFVLWGVNIEDSRQDAGMSWSSTTASATITDDGVEFTAPELTLGNAHDVTYSSTNGTIASISSSGVVSVLAAGTTTIKASFAGDHDYKPETKEYTLTVTDNRTPVNTPTTVSMTSFTAISGFVDNDNNITYEATKGTAGTAPAVNSNEIRIYQNGGLLTITANNNKKITSITIGSSMATTVQTSVDEGSSFSSNNSISANGTFTISNINASSVVFKCTGTSKTERLYLNYLSVTYL